MRKLTYLSLNLVLFVGMLMCLERRAYAYVDPGSSLVLYQGASSVVLGVIYYFRKRLKSFFVRSRPAEDSHDRQL